MPGLEYEGPTSFWPEDLITRKYADARMFAFEPMSVGWFALPPGANTSATGAAVFNRIQWTPFFVGPVPWNTDALQLNVTTAAAGGAAPSVEVALYADDGTGAPLTQGGPLRTASITGLTTTGLKLGTFTALTLNPGLYWVASRYTYTTVPTTAPVFTTISTTTWQLSNPTGVTQGSVRAYILTGQTSWPSGALPTVSFTGASDVPLMALRRSA